MPEIVIVIMLRLIFRRHLQQANEQTQKMLGCQNVLGQDRIQIFTCLDIQRRLPSDGSPSASPTNKPVAQVSILDKK